MFRRSLGTIALIASSVLGAASVGTLMQPAPMVQNVTTASARKTRRSGTGAPELRAWGYLGPGTTMAQQQRASRKTRNVKRHRAAARR
jgi:hypothetical protein